jgi:hypothetical protein
MAKKLFPALISATVILLLSACGREDQKATKPAYLSIDALNLETNYSDEGTASSDITTVWIFANDVAVGTFELPCTIPILADGNTTLEILPGITMNGIDATRAIYTPFEAITRNVSFTPLDTLSLGTIPVNYASSANLNVIENFDETGQNLVANLRSDTALLKTSKASEVFINPDNVENNGEAGVITLVGERSFFEVNTIDKYNLPRGSRSVFLEMNYKNDIPILVGVIADNPEGDIQAQTITLNTQEDWNKIYINLVTEISSFPSASGFQIFIGGFKSSSMDTARVYLDNLKIVY